MILLGGLCAATAAAALVLSARPISAVGRRLELVAPRARGAGRGWRAATDVDLRHAGIGPDRIVALKIVAGLAGALAAACLSLFVPIGPAVVPAAGFGGSLVPSLFVERRAKGRRAEAEHATAVLVERLDALVAAGRPPETALALLMARPTGAAVLDGVMRRASDAHTLGAPIFRTLAAHARDEGLVTCAAVADDLDRMRDLGAGSLAAIVERRNALRAAERARAIASAAQVEGKLMLILVLCYLPALVLLVVIPLFIGLLEGLFP